jgi:Kdo2-lipid IVA lauroyltransferase/acyltransferase
MKFFTYLIFRFFIFIFRITPFPILYIFSDLIAFLLKSVLKYRYDVVKQNIELSFPHFNKEQIKMLIDRFYRNLSDITLETMKSYSMSPDQIKKRNLVINPDFLDEHFKMGQSVCCITSHYANWEWAALTAGYYIKHKNNGFYRPLSNNYIDKFLKKNRIKSGMNLYPVQITARAFFENKEVPSMFVMVADQSPSKVEQAYWYNFLGRKTAFIHGPEMYARKFELPVYFADIQRKQRGYYEISIIEICKNPLELPEGEITNRYKNLLEQIIIKKPEDWLWSHRRWKIKFVENTTVG